MTEICLHALARSALVALICAGAGLALTKLATARRRQWLWALILTPALAPAILIGYAYSGFAFSLIRFPFWNEALYTLLCAARLAPVVVLVLVFAPRGMSPSAAFIAADLSLNRRLFLTRWRPLLVATGICFLLASIEFEIASLMAVPHWTVTLFDAQVGGMLLGATLRMATLPCLLVAGIALVLLTILLRQGPVAESAQDPPARGCPQALGAVWLGLALLLLVVYPLGIILGDGAPSLPLLLGDAWLLRDTGTSTGFALVAALCAWWLAGWAVEGGHWRWAVAMALPGSTGALLISLELLASFQLPVLRLLRDTPLPLLLALILQILPFALLLILLLRRLRPSTATHLAQSRELRWRLIGRQHCWAFFLLFFLAFLDLTSTAILAPGGISGIFTRLYNLMHYGHSEKLSAMVIAAVLTPVLLLPLFRFVSRRWQRV
jgi:ABC-type Fe3+ transport system permease subunit